MDPEGWTIVCRVTLWMPGAERSSREGSCRAPAVWNYGSWVDAALGRAALDWEQRMFLEALRTFFLSNNTTQTPAHYRLAHCPPSPSAAALLDSGFWIFPYLGALGGTPSSLIPPLSQLARSWIYDLGLTQPAPKKANFFRIQHPKIQDPAPRHPK